MITHVCAYGAVHSRLFQASLTIQLHPTNKPSRPPEGSAAHKALKPITIAVQQLSDWLYTCTGTKQMQTARAINTRNTLTNGQD